MYVCVYVCMCTPTISARFVSAAVSCSYVNVCVCMCMVMYICTCVCAPAYVCSVCGGDGSTYSQNICRRSCQVFRDTRGVDTFVNPIQIREFVGVGTGIGVDVDVGVATGVCVGTRFGVGVGIGFVLLEKCDRLFLPQN